MDVHVVWRKLGCQETWGSKCIDWTLRKVVLTCSLAESHFQSRGGGEAAAEKLRALAAAVRPPTLTSAALRAQIGCTQIRRPNAKDRGSMRMIQEKVRQGSAEAREMKAMGAGPRNRSCAVCNAIMCCSHDLVTADAARGSGGWHSRLLPPHHHTPPFTHHPSRSTLHAPSSILHPPSSILHIPRIFWSFQIALRIGSKLRVKRHRFQQTCYVFENDSEQDRLNVSSQ
jgi:hypothetical protein